MSTWQGFYPLYFLEAISEVLGMESWALRISDYMHGILSAVASKIINPLQQALYCHHHNGNNWLKGQLIASRSRGQGKMGKRFLLKV